MFTLVWRRNFRLAFLTLLTIIQWDFNEKLLARRKISTKSETVVKLFSGIHNMHHTAPVTCKTQSEGENPPDTDTGNKSVMNEGIFYPLVVNIIYVVTDNRCSPSLLISWCVISSEGHRCDRLECQYSSSARVNPSIQVHPISTSGADQWPWLNEFLKALRGIQTPLTAWHTFRFSHFHGGGKKQPLSNISAI